MIRSAILLMRTSLVSVLFLVAAVMTLASVMTEDPDETSDTRPESIPSLAPLLKVQAPGGTAAPALQSALFDPARRPETLSGSIDDLRPKSAADSGPSPVAIAGVMLDGTIRKAMLAAQGATSAWSAVGAEVGGWRVASIDADGALLERDGQTLSLKVAERYKLRSKPQTDTAAAQQAPAMDEHPPEGGPAPDASSGALQPPDAIAQSQP